MSRKRKPVDHAKYAALDRKRLASAKEKLAAIEAKGLPLRRKLLEIERQARALDDERKRTVAQIRAAERGADGLREEIAGLLIQHGATTE